MEHQDDHTHHEHDHAHHDHASGHAHGMPIEGVNLRMGIAVALNLAFVVIEGGFGFLSNSVALIADAGHNLSDVLGLVCAWGALLLGRRPPGAKFTYGLGRSSVLAALVNAAALGLRRHCVGSGEPARSTPAGRRKDCHGRCRHWHSAQRHQRLDAARRQSR
jgi:Co/Zn/Cd efflux system component